MNAARLSEVFHTSPLELLDCSDEEWLILMACAKVVENDREKMERDRELQKGS
jgi:hypothetical protein|tara:strand:- start:207 stop:365 length:159 start_codon:yes stop_codon:yes gene_type:complete